MKALMSSQNSCFPQNLSSYFAFLCEVPCLFQPYTTLVLRLAQTQAHIWKILIYPKEFSLWTSKNLNKIFRKLVWFPCPSVSTGIYIFCISNYITQYCWVWKGSLKILWADRCFKLLYVPHYTRSNSLKVISLYDISYHIANLNWGLFPQYI